MLVGIHDKHRGHWQTALPLLPIGHTVGMGGSQIRIRQQLKTYPPIPYYADFWDELLTAGHRLWGFANDDFHDPAISTTPSTWYW